MDAWIVTGTACGDVRYGCDMICYIFGVYQTKDEAEDAKNMFSSSNDPAKVLHWDGAKCEAILAKYYGGTIEALTEDKLKDEADLYFEDAPNTEAYSDLVLKYCDIDYAVIHFTGQPVFCAGASYLE